MNILFMCLGILMFLTGVHFIMRIVVVDWAKKRRFFTSPNIGRIQQRIRGGRVVGYLANMKGLTEIINREDEQTGDLFDVRVYLDVDEETGEVIHVDQPIWRGFWWKLYGVRFIGLDDIQSYDLEVSRIENDGSIIKEVVKAHSLHFSGIYPVILEGREATETVEGIPINLRLRITTRTHHAGHCLKYKSQWLNKLISAVKSALRDFVGKNRLHDLLKMQVENPENDTLGLVAFIRSLNTGEHGNSGLVETLGQEIVDVNLESIEIEPETAEAMKQEQLTKERMAAELAEAQRMVQIAEENKRRAIIEADAEAERTRRTGAATNEILRGRFNAVGGTDGVVGLAKWESLREIKDLKGTLVLSEDAKSTPSILLPSGKEVK